MPQIFYPNYFLVYYDCHTNQRCTQYNIDNITLPQNILC